MATKQWAKSMNKSTESAYIGILIILVLALLFFTFEPSFTGQAVREPVVVDIVPTASSFAFTDTNGNQLPDPGEAFSLAGSIADPESGDAVGSFVSRGFFIVPEDDGIPPYTIGPFPQWNNISLGPFRGNIAFASESFDLTGRGEISVIGKHPGFVNGVPGIWRSVVGGTGQFAGASGQMKIELTPTSENPLKHRASFLWSR